MNDPTTNDLLNARIVSMELHPTTGELLTLYVKSTTGKIIRIAPIDYKMWLADGSYKVI